MAYTHENKNSGDLIKSDDWNKMGDGVEDLFQEVQTLKDSKVDNSGDTIDGDLELVGDLDLKKEGESDALGSSIRFSPYNFYSGGGTNEYPGFDIVNNGGHCRVNINQERAVDILGGLDVSKDTTIGGELSVSGNLTVDKQLLVDGSVGIGTESVNSGNKLEVKGHIYGTSLHIDGAINSKGGLIVGYNRSATLKVRYIDGKSYDSNNGDHLYLQNSNGKNVVIGKSDKKSNLYIYGNVGINAKGNLAVDGGISAKGNLAVDGDISAKGNLTVKGDIIVSGHIKSPSGKCRLYLGDDGRLIIWSGDEIVWVSPVYGSKSSVASSGVSATSSTYDPDFGKSGSGSNSPTSMFSINPESSNYNPNFGQSGSGSK